MSEVIQMQLSFDEVKVERVKNKLTPRTGSQNDLVLNVFKNHIDYDFTPVEVLRYVLKKDKTAMITSIRRSITELTNAGYLVKNKMKRKKEIYSATNGTWRLKIESPP